MIRPEIRFGLTGYLAKSGSLAPTLYYVFDVLWHNSEDLTGEPILERRRLLEGILRPTPGIQLGSYVEAEGKALFNLTKDKGMEGIIAKRKDSIYRPGKRTSDWLKIKARLQQEFVVGGFTTPKGSRKYLGAVVLGAYTKGKLRHYGYAGSGFSEKGLKVAADRMKLLFIDKCPSVNPPNIKEKIQRVRPKLVCEGVLPGYGPLQFLQAELVQPRKTLGSLLSAICCSRSALLAPRRCSPGKTGKPRASAVDNSSRESLDSGS